MFVVQLRGLFKNPEVCYAGYLSCGIPACSGLEGWAYNVHCIVTTLARPVVQQINGNMVSTKVSTGQPM